MPLQSQFRTVSIPKQPLYELLLDAIWTHGARNPQKPAIIDGENEGRSITFREIHTQAHSAAAFLRSRGFGHGDTAAVVLSNCWEYSVFFLGASLCGGAVSGASPMFTDFELGRQFKDSQCKVIFASDTILPKIRLAVKDCPNVHTIVLLRSDVRRQLPSDVFEWDDVIRTAPNYEAAKMKQDVDADMCLLPYSSGTTGSPKGVILTHTNLITMVKVFAAHADFYLMPAMDANWQWENETQLNFLPYSHIYGFFLMIHSFIRGCTAVVLRHFEANNFLRAIQTYKIRMLNVVPPILVFLAKSPVVANYDVSSLEMIMSGAAPAGKDLCEELVAKHPNIRVITQGYGMTEMGLASHFPYVDSKAKFGNAGKLASNFEAMIVDLQTGKECGPNEKGEMWVRGKSVMKGYLNRPEATKETLDDQGWLHTGDIGYHDENGYLFVVDRLKELIKVRGFQVPPAELEDLLLSNPDIQDAAVIGIPDKASGELPRAYVVRKHSNITAQQVSDYIKSKVSYYKQLKGGVEFVEEIPKSPSGKILRRFLRDRAMASLKGNAKL